ncbi:DUF362 domain-containing protein [bacterium]|nr:DUF362 domain-containing protein [bacterium]
MRHPVPVALVPCKSYTPAELYPAIDRTVEYLGGWSQMAGRGETVLVKPNFLSARPAPSAVTTHPAVILGVVERLLDLGARVIVGDSNAFGTVLKTMDGLGILEPLRQRGVECVDFSREAHKLVRLPESGFKLRIARHALDADRIINLPKVKVHCQLVLTLGVKNLFGTIPARRKAWLHMRLGGRRERFSAMLLALADRLAPVLTLADGVVMMDKHGPQGGQPRLLGVLCASPSPLAVDRTLCQVLGVPPEKVNVLAEARRQDRREAFMPNLEILGASIAEVAVHDITLPTMMPIRFSLWHMLKAQLRQWKTRRAKV